MRILAWAFVTIGSGILFGSLLAFADTAGGLFGGLESITKMPDFVRLCVGLGVALLLAGVALLKCDGFQFFGMNKE